MPSEQTEPVETLEQQAQTEEVPTEKEPVQPDPEDKLLQRMAELNSTISDQALTAKVLSDPDFRRIVEARQSGKKVKIVDENAELAQPEPEEEVDLDNLPPSKLATHMLKQMGKLVQSEVRKALEPVESRLNLIGSSVQETEKEKANSQVQSAREKFKDFDLFTPTMIEINKANKGLSVEELYLLAKRRAGGNKTAPNPVRVSSEKPTSSTSRSSKVDEKKNYNGRDGFADLVADALKGKVIKTEFTPDELEEDN